MPLFAICLKLRFLLQGFHNHQNKNTRNAKPSDDGRSSKRRERTNKETAWRGNYGNLRAVGYGDPKIWAGKVLKS